MSSLLQHLRFGARALRRAPRFAWTAVLTLALGIGLATAVFTVAEALLLRRLPVADQERLVILTGRTPDGRMDNWPLSLDEGRAFAGQTRALSRVTFFGYEGATPKPVRLGVDGAADAAAAAGPNGAPGRDQEVTRLRRALVAGDYFAVLGTRPLLGRALRPEDDATGAAPVVVLSHRTWREHFGAAPDVVGRRLTFLDDGTTASIVGVMPAGLDWPRGTEVWSAVRASVPQAALPYLSQHVLGRLAPGATPERAGAELTAFFRRDGAPPPVRKLTGVVHTLPERVLGTTRPAVLVFAGAAALLLVITCVNVATLCLVRAGAREREVGVRAAIGAGRGRLIAQFLAEHALIAAAGGALGVGVAAAAVGAFVRFAPAGPTGLPRVDEIHLNMAALVGAVAISGVALVLFGLAPAFRGVAGATSSRLATTLRSGTRQSASRGSRLAMEGLVAGQIALALVVLSAAALLVQSLRRLERADLAFAGSRLVVAELALRTDRYPTAERQAAVITQLAREIGALPGVQAVSPVVAAPFSGSGGWDGRPRVEGQSPQDAAGNPMLNMEVVAPDYFAALGLAPVHGRLLTADDRQGAPPVVVLSASAARALGTIVGATAGAAAGGGDAALIGRRLLLAGDQAATVVGVVPDTRYRDLREARASIYFPLGQSPFPFAPTTLVIGTSGARGGAPDALVPALGRVVADAAPGVTLAHAAPFAAYMDAPLAQPRLNALLLVAFAGAAVVLAAVGVFGVMATMVRQRTRELGMRVALGATARDVVRLVLTRGLAVGAAGAAAGVLGALALNRFLGALLYDVSPTDAATLGAAAALLVVLGGLAALGPAWTGARVDPATTLRAE